MSERRKYKVIVSDRAKQMLGVHIRFLAQVDKDAARNKKKELMEAMRSLAYSPNRFPFLNEAAISFSCSPNIINIEPVPATPKSKRKLTNKL